MIWFLFVATSSSSPSIAPVCIFRGASVSAGAVVRPSATAMQVEKKKQQQHLWCSSGCIRLASMAKHESSGEKATNRLYISRTSTPVYVFVCLNVTVDFCHIRSINARFWWNHLDQEQTIDIPFRTLFVVARWITIGLESRSAQQEPSPPSLVPSLFNHKKEPRDWRLRRKRRRKKTQTRHTAESRLLRGGPQSPTSLTKSSILFHFYQ